VKLRARDYGYWPGALSPLMRLLDRNGVDRSDTTD
jgi:hypothetical protein